VTEGAELRDRLGFIEGLRGLAIGVVLVFHAGIWASVTGRPSQVLGFGHAGVDLFFVISGFCMMWPNLHHGSVRPIDAPRFYMRRALRIAPPYWVAVAIAVGASALMWVAGGRSSWSHGKSMQSVFPTSTPHLVENLATHATFTFGFLPAFSRSIDGAFWSLSTEWQFYVLLPVLIVVARRWSVPAVVAVTAVVPALWVLGLQAVYPRALKSVGTDLIAFRLVEFGIGMLAAWLLSSHRRVPLIRTLVVVGLVVGGVIDHYVNWLSYGWAVGFGALVMGCATVPALRRCAEWEPLRWLGRVSFSTYLIHGTVFLLLAVVMTRLRPSVEVRTAVMFLIGIPLGVLVATGLNRLIEIPAVRWSHAVRGLRTPDISATEKVATNQ
jgi:peptidoglycan/LPS O-acetylase OafA/YrhL